MKKSNSCMEGMTKTIGDNQDRICFLESLNRQLKGTVEHKDKQTQEVGNIEWSIKKLFMNLGNGYSKVGGELAHGQAQGPKLFRLGPIAGATIPFISLQVGGSKPSNFAVLLVFLT